MSKLVCFRLNERAFQRLNAMDISPQKLAQYLVDSWLNEHEDDIGVLFNIYALENKIAKMSDEIIELEHKKRLREDLQKELVVYKAQYKDSLGYVELHHLLQYLNKRIIMYQYKEKDIADKHKDIIDRILAKDPDFDLKKQIEMVKKMRSDFII